MKRKPALEMIPLVTSPPPVPPVDPPEPEPLPLPPEPGLPPPFNVPSGVVDAKT